MSFIHFIIDTPVVALLALLALLVIVGSLVARLASRGKRSRSNSVDAPQTRLQISRFPGIQLDLAILMLGLLLLLGLAGWVWKLLAE
jgi:hypothetical protein